MCCATFECFSSNILTKLNIYKFRTIFESSKQKKTKILRLLPIVEQNYIPVRQLTKK